MLSSYRPTCVNPARATLTPPRSHRLVGPYVCQTISSMHLLRGFIGPLEPRPRVQSTPPNLKKSNEPAASLLGLRPVDESRAWRTGNLGSNVNS
jgi:hypothetical protein